MPDDRKPSPLELGLYARAEAEPRITLIEIVAGALTLVWLLAVLFFGVGGAERWRIGRRGRPRALRPCRSGGASARRADLGGGGGGAHGAEPAPGGQPPAGLHRRHAHRLCGAAAERRAQHQARASAPLRGIACGAGRGRGRAARHLHVPARAGAAGNACRHGGGGRRDRRGRAPAFARLRPARPARADLGRRNSSRR